MTRPCLIAAALVAFCGCFADVTLGDRSEGEAVDAGGGIDACVCASPQTNACGNCPGASTCDPASGVVCPCGDPTDCAPGFTCVPADNATGGSECVPQNEAGIPSNDCQAGDPVCNAAR